MQIYNTIIISDALDERLRDVCAALGTTPEALIAECVAAHLDTKEVEAACAPEIPGTDPAARARITDRLFPVPIHSSSTFSVRRSAFSVQQAAA